MFTLFFRKEQLETGMASMSGRVGYMSLQTHPWGDAKTSHQGSFDQLRQQMIRFVSPSFNKKLLVFCLFWQKLLFSSIFSKEWTSTSLVLHFLPDT